MWGGGVRDQRIVEESSGRKKSSAPSAPIGTDCVRVAVQKGAEFSQVQGSALPGLAFGVRVQDISSLHLSLSLSIRSFRS